MVELVRKLFFEMLRIRLVEEGIAELYGDQEMRCPVHLCVGQEAVAVGICAHLDRNDWVMSGHRAHGHYLAKGGSLKGMMAEIYGRATGCCGGRGGSMHLCDLEAGFLGSTPIVAATIPIAVGAAFGSVLRGEPRIVVACFGEAATEEGAFHEAANFASLKKLPVLFLCENNLYSVYSPMTVRQPAHREVFRQAQGHGIDSQQLDGNDVRQVFDIGGQVIADMRQRPRPIFLECHTYRWREHCGHLYDNHLGYRTEAEFEHWQELCPLERLRRQGLSEGELSATEVTAMTERIQAEFREAVRFAKESPFPRPETLMDHIYADAGS